MPLNQASKRVKFGPIDGTALFPFLFLLINPSWNMFYILLGFSFLLVVLDYYGLKLTMLTRLVRSRLAGDNRIIRPLTRQKK